MYRSYEDPYWIERQLESLEADLSDAIARDDEDAVISISEEIAELRDRLNFAWQDDEYDSYEIA